MAEDKKPINFGIMGCAKISRKIARAITMSQNSTLYAIASRTMEKANQFATTIINNGGPSTVKAYGSYEEVFDDPVVDVVYMPLPASLHVQWAISAAQKGKHLLLEKPAALDVVDLDKILQACETNGVQFMDGSMCLHHPRTIKLREMINDPLLIGQVDFLYSTSTKPASTEFLENDIRVKPELDALGALGDLGWYCIGSVLWAKSYKLPSSVTALPDVKKNSSGVILSCTASLQYEHDKTNAIFHVSFLSHSTMELQIVGSNGSLHLDDYIIPHREDSASFDFTWRPKFVDLHVGWNVKPEKIVVTNELPQEALMIQELARIVEGIKSSASRPERLWPEISRKTQLVLDAVKKSIDLGCQPVYL